MIKTLRNYLLHNSEFLQFIYDVLSICSKHKAKTTDIQKQVTELNTCVIDLASVFKIDQGSILSKTLHNLDQRRDNCFIGTCEFIQSHLRSSIASVQMAAQLLENNIDKYGDRIANLNYPAETSTINSILKDWENDSQLLSATELLNLAPWINELQTTNQEFNNIFMNRVEETNQKPSLKTIEARKATTAAYRTLVQHIDARALLATDNSYEALVGELNVLIVKYNRVAQTHIMPDDPTSETNPPMPPAR